MLKTIFLKAIKIYQKGISPFLGDHCRFYPSCSEYAFISIQKKGASKGLLRGIYRILRCHPWSVGGVDLPR